MKQAENEKKEWEVLLSRSVPSIDTNFVKQNQYKVYGVVEKNVQQ